ncbi:hypothetical protein [Pontimicrobium sp. MEBiC01747]|jgi:hypothetical protein
MEEKLKYRQTGNKKTIIIGSVIATFIAITPYLFYLHEIVPNTATWETLIYTFHSEIYEDVQVVVWTLTGKIIPLILLIIWFFTCRHWWYHALLVPIAMYLYQIISFSLSNSFLIDEFELIHIIPFIAVIIPSIYLIRARLFNRLNSVGKSIQELEDELKMKPKGIKGVFNQYF